MKQELVHIPIGEDERVSGVLSIPERHVPGTGTGVIIAHGAGNDMNHSMIVFLADQLAAAGFSTLRFNFPYQEKGGKAPDSQSVLVATWLSAVRFMFEHPDARPASLVATGKSMGGRVASQMAAEGKLPAERLIFLGYPLHPPGKKEQLRDSHLYDIALPMLFFAGSRDALCDLDLLQAVLPKLKSSWELEIIEGGDHSFRLPKAMGDDESKVYERILNRTLSWLQKGQDSA